MQIDVLREIWSVDPTAHTALASIDISGFPIPWCYSWRNDDVTQAVSAMDRIAQVRDGRLSVRIVWWRMGANVLVWSVICAAFMFAFGCHRVARLHFQRRCIGCGFSIMGMSRCAECGRVVGLP